MVRIYFLLSHVLLWLRYRSSGETPQSPSKNSLTNSISTPGTFDCDHHQISFLDLLISIDNGSLVTKTYRKESVEITLLEADSQHPKSLIGGIPTRQFLRIRSNCALSSDYKREAVQLYQRFRESKYLHRTPRRSRKKASQRPRLDLLKMQENRLLTKGPRSSKDHHPIRHTMGGS